MYKLVVGETQWLYDGPEAIRQATFAAHILMRRQGISVAFIVPYGGSAGGEAIVINRR
jgi:hypothetical protein